MSSVAWAEGAGADPIAPIIDTGAMGLRPRTPIVQFEIFASGPGHVPEVSAPHHMMLIPLSPDPLRLDHGRGGAMHELSLSRGDIVMTPADTPASWRWHDHAEVALIWIDPALIPDFIATELRTIVTRRNLGEHILLRDVALADIAASLRSALSEAQIGRDVLFDSLSRVFMVRMFNMFSVAEVETVQLGSGAFDARRYRAIADFVAANLDRRLTIAELAGVVGMSTSRFSRAFKASTSRTPMEFVMGQRIARAKDLLAEDRLSLGQIAVRCGFADQAHMTRSFKSATGFTPSAWRHGPRSAA